MKRSIFGVRKTFSSWSGGLHQYLSQRDEGDERRRASRKIAVDRWKMPLSRRMAKKVVHVFKKLRKEAKVAAHKSFGAPAALEVRHTVAYQAQ